jgi:hypothetical protein
MNSALLLQVCNSASPHSQFGVYSGIFYDMLRLSYPRHSAYARAHQMDYWHIMGDQKEMLLGAWPKVLLIRDALKAGYPFIAYLDTDAVVWNMECDLRDALPADKLIGAVLHDPAKSAYLQSAQVPAHQNVGVLYFRNDPLTHEFIEDWLASYPVDDRWQEQGVFNTLIASDKYKDITCVVDDTWNATVNVNMVTTPAVMAWHGIMPPERRLDMMRNTLADDHLRFRV